MNQPKFGRAGYCKLCRWEQEPDLNRLIKAGKNAAECNRWATDKFGFSFTRQTFYAHKEHVEKGVSATGRDVVKTDGALEIKRTTNREFLETIRDIGYTKAQLNPGEVTLEQSLKAASILEQSKQKQSDIHIVFAQVVTGHPPDVVIVGTAREVSPA